jgi:hypothetical protein
MSDTLCEASIIIWKHDGNQFEKSWELQGHQAGIKKIVSSEEQKR